MDSNSSKEMPLLTFNSLYNLLRDEKRIKKLQELPELFYEATEEFLNNKKKEIERLKGKPDKLKKEKHILKKSKEIFTELLNLRSQKIANIAIKDELFGEETLSKDNVLEKELVFFETVKKSTKKLKKL